MWVIKIIVDEGDGDFELDSYSISEKESEESVNNVLLISFSACASMNFLC